MHAHKWLWMMFYRQLLPGFLILALAAACSRIGPQPAQPSPAAPTAPGTAATATVLPTFPARMVISPQNVERIQTVREIQTDGALNFVWLPEGQLAIATENQIELYGLRAAAQAAPQEVQVETPVKIAASPDRQALAWATDAEQIQFWQVTAGAANARTLAAAPADVTGLALSPQGDTLASSTADNQLQLLNTAAGQVQDRWQLPAWLTDLSYSSDGTRIAGADLQNFMVRIFDVASGQEIQTYSWTEHASPVLYGAFVSPGWETLAWVARGTVQLMDMQTGELGPLLSHEDFVSGVSWAPDGSLIATAAAGTVEGIFTPLVTIWEAASGEAIHTLPLSEPALSLEFSPDGRELGVLGSQGVLQVFAVTR